MTQRSRLRSTRLTLQASAQKSRMSLFLPLEREPEQGQRLIGKTPGDTAARLSGWMHDYLYHNSAELNVHQFHRDNPLLTDRLKRHVMADGQRLYITSRGCWSASALFADLMRHANVPVRKVTNKLETFSGAEQSHSGLMFDWQGGVGTGRYLLHTDDLFTTSWFQDPAPAPRGTHRGTALWNHVWLAPSQFGQAFSYDARSDIFASATVSQKERYCELGDWQVVSAQSVRIARNLGRRGVLDHLRNKGYSPTEAEACWLATEESVTSQGDGDMALGYMRLLDGPDSRHAKWCQRTGKCH